MMGYRWSINRASYPNLNSLVVRQGAANPNRWSMNRPPPWRPSEDTRSSVS